MEQFSLVDCDGWFFCLGSDVVSSDRQHLKTLPWAKPWSRVKYSCSQFPPLCPVNWEMEGQMGQKAGERLRADDPTPGQCVPLLHDCATDSRDGAAGH